MSKIVLEENHILFSDDVDEEAAKRLATILVNSTAVHKEIFLHINSPGGQSIAGFKMHSALRAIGYMRRDVSVSTIGYEQINSAAIIVFLGCEKRFIDPDAHFCFHETILMTKKSGIKLTQKELVLILAKIRNNKCFCHIDDVRDFFEFYVEIREESVSLKSISEVSSLRRLCGTGKHFCGHKEYLQSFIEDTLKSCQETQKKYIELVAISSGMAINTVTELLVDERTLTAEEALRMGIATHNLAGIK